MATFQEILTDRLQHAGLRFTALQLERLCAFQALLEEANRSFNLISAANAEEMVSRHFLDSLAAPALELLFPVKSAVDVGSGAGFPGVPLAIVLEDVRFTLLDSTRKRTDFLSSAVAALGLGNVTVVNARAEDFARVSAGRERFDAALSRAVAALPVLLEYTLPFVRVGGSVLAWKGPSAPAEMEQALRAAAVLGGAPPLAHRYSLSAHQDFYLVEVKKNRPTPSNYPRKAGVPTKTPLK